MRLEEQVTSLDISKRLKTLDVPQESLFYWYKSVYTEAHPDGWKIGGLEVKPYEGEKYSAFTVAELGAMLPAEIDHYYSLRLTKDSLIRYHYVVYKPVAEGTEVLFAVGDETEADARAKALLYLLKGGYIKSEELGTK
jgi:hypothetical protein